MLVLVLMLALKHAFNITNTRCVRVVCILKAWENE